VSSALSQISSRYRSLNLPAGRALTTPVISMRSLLQNKLSEQDARAFVSETEGLPRLTTLCGIDPKQTTVDLSRRDLDAGDAILLAFDLQRTSTLAELKYANPHRKAIVRRT